MLSAVDTSFGLCYCSGIPAGRGATTCGLRVNGSSNLHRALGTHQVPMSLCWSTCNLEPHFWFIVIEWATSFRAPDPVL